MEDCELTRQEQPTALDCEPRPESVAFFGLGVGVVPRFEYRPRRTVAWRSRDHRRLAQLRAAIT